MPSFYSQRIDIMLLSVAPEVIEQSGATTASDIWYVEGVARLSFPHALTLGVLAVSSLSF